MVNELPDACNNGGMQKDKFCMPIPFCGAYILFRQTLEYKKNSKGVKIPVSRRNKKEVDPQWKPFNEGNP